MNGTIDCSTADIEGSVKGSLKATNILSLKSSSKIEGEVFIGKHNVFRQTGNLGNLNHLLVLPRNHAIESIIDRIISRNYLNVVMLQKKN